MKLVTSYDISALLKTLHLTLHLFTDTQLYDHLVTSYIYSYNHVFMN